MERCRRGRKEPFLKRFFLPFLQHLPFYSTHILLVDYAAGVAVVVVSDSLFGGTDGGVEVGFKGICAEVWEHNVGDISDRFFTGDIFGIDVVAEEDCFGFLSFTEIFFINNACAGAVDEDGAVFHEIEKFFVDHTAGFVIFGDVERDEVSLCENFFNGAEFNADRSGFFFRNEGVESESFDVETGEAFNEELTDMTEAEDTDGFAGDFTTHEFGFFPIAFAG